MPSKQNSLPKRRDNGNQKGRLGAQERYRRWGQALEKNAPALVEQVVELAMAGDREMLKLCFDRLLPRLKSVDITHELGETYASLLNQIHGRIGPPQQFNHGITMEGEAEKVGEWTLPKVEKEPLNGGSS